MSRPFTGYSRSSLLPENVRGPVKRRSVVIEKYARNPFYQTTKWRDLSKYVRKQDPFCQLCILLNKLSFAESVDHADGDTNNNAYNNLLPLCNTCHSWKTIWQEKGVEGCKLQELEIPDLTEEIRAELSQLAADRYDTNRLAKCPLYLAYLTNFQTDFKW